MEKSIVALSLVTASLLALAFTGRDQVSYDTLPPSGINFTKCPENGIIFRSDYWKSLYGIPDTIPVPPPPPVPPAVIETEPPAAFDADEPAPPAAPPSTPVPPRIRGKKLTDTVPLPAAPPAPTMQGSPARPDAPASVIEVRPATPRSPSTAPAAVTSIRAAVETPVTLTAIATVPVPGTPLVSEIFAGTPPANTDGDRDKIVKEMIADGLIRSDDNKISFKLSTTEFIINGKKQSQQVFEKYRKEYVKQTGKGTWSWYYNYDSETTVH